MEGYNSKPFSPADDLGSILWLLDGGGDWFTGRGFLDEWRNRASAVASRSTSSFISCEASEEDVPHDLPLVGSAIL
jgi:hypothetical protein